MSDETMAALVDAERAVLVERARMCAGELAQMARDTVRVSAERRAVLRRLLDLGMSRQEVADAIGVSLPRVGQLLNVHTGGAAVAEWAATQNGPGP